MNGHAAPPKVMAGRYGEESAGVIVEPGKVEVAGGLNHLIKIACNPIGAVVKPPRWPNPQAGPMACHRRQSARIGGFVEREKNEAQLRRIANPVEQCVQTIHPIGGEGDIGAHVTAEPV